MFAFTYMKQTCKAWHPEKPANWLSRCAWGWNARCEIGEQVPLDRLERGELLYNLLRECAGITISRAEETLHAVVARRIESTLLNIPAGSPAFLVERRGFVGARMVEFRRSLIRGDRYQFRVDLMGDSLDEPSAARSPGAIRQIGTPVSGVSTVQMS